MHARYFEVNVIKKKLDWQAKIYGMMGHKGIMGRYNFRSITIIYCAISGQNTSDMILVP